MTIALRSVCVTLMAILFAFSCQLEAANEKVLDSVIAVVNKDVITDSDLQSYLTFYLARLGRTGMNPPSEAVLRPQLLERMISEKLQVQLAKKFGIEVDDSKIEQAIHEIASQEGYASLEAMKDWLSQHHVSFKKFRELIKTEMIIMELQQREVGQQVRISKADVDSFLNSAAGKDQSGIEYHLGHILLQIPELPGPDVIATTEKNALNIIETLRKGADFSQLAMARSQDQQALKGGDLGWRKMAELPTLFAKEVPGMKVGEVLGPIRSSSGFHIIKLLDKRGGVTAETETHVRHILLKLSSQLSDAEAEQKLEKWRKELLAGADFMTLARKHSQESSTAQKGGDIGWITKSSVMPAFYEKVAALKVGELSPPFKTELGWHVVQVLGRRTGFTSSEAARNQAVEVLSRRKFEEAVGPWLKRLRDDAKVDIKDKSLAE